MNEQTLKVAQEYLKAMAGRRCISAVLLSSQDLLMESYKLADIIEKRAFGIAQEMRKKESQMPKKGKK